jgi:hypothetical protein
MLLTLCRPEETSHNGPDRRQFRLPGDVGSLIGDFERPLRAADKSGRTVKTYGGTARLLFRSLPTQAMPTALDCYLRKRSRHPDANRRWLWLQPTRGDVHGGCFDPTTSPTEVGAAAEHHPDGTTTHATDRPIITQTLRLRGTAARDDTGDVDGGMDRNSGSSGSSRVMLAFWPADDDTSPTETGPERLVRICSRPLGCRAVRDLGPT